MTTRSDPPSPAAVARPRQSRRLQLAWIAFVLAALATAYGVYRLYATVQRELDVQSAAAMRPQQEEMIARMNDDVRALRLATMRSLVAFHSENLGYYLRNWDEATPAVVGTFEWDSARGFLPGSVIPPALAARTAELPALWQEFRAHRARNPGAPVTDPRLHLATWFESYWKIEYSTVDTPLFSPGELGYQGENLDMLRYAGRPVDPWTGWAARAGEPLPWIIWYQAGPDAPVRGCFVDPAPLIARWRQQMLENTVTQFALVGAKEGAVDLESTLPGFALKIGPGSVFMQKQNDVRMVSLGIALLLGIFLLGAVLLALYSRREMREAEMKTTFVAQVSHELRTPLTSIRMFADMLTGPDLAEEKRTRFARTISRESTRLGALIERLLLFNSLEHGGPNGEIATVDVGAVIRETLDEMEATLAAAGMHVESDLPAAPQLALTERSALKQALLNLLENALKYARDGRVIRIELARVGDEVRVSVADAGPGVPRELGARAFEPFVQGGRNLTDKSPGVGLGLSIARGWLRRVRGDLVLLPSEKGARFEIRLPATSSA